jgi:hypothetical protein
VDPNWVAQNCGGWWSLVGLRVLCSEGPGVERKGGEGHGAHGDPAVPSPNDGRLGHRQHTGGQSLKQAPVNSE